MFSAEQINLMCIFDTSSRNTLRNSLHDVYDPEMQEIYGNTIEKLEKISDDDFADIGLYIADEYIDGEEYGGG